jgi:iron complex outermembrane receptor protein
VTRQLRVTPGIKMSRYQQDFTQYADNGKTVGSLNGAAFIQHGATYTATEPSFDVHYLIRPNWSTYGQFATGDNIPPSKAFDVKNAQVTTLPKPIRARTYQTGTVLKVERMTLDFDVYQTKFDNDYSSTTDAAGNTDFFSNGKATSKGVEGEATVGIARGIFVYVNATKGASRFADTHLWLQNTPRDTETIGVTYGDAHWSTGVFAKRVGTMFNDNGSVHEAYTIDPVTIANLFVNYTLRGSSVLGRSKIKFGVNNLFNNQSITGVNAASSKSSVPAPGDILTLVSARSVSLALTVDFKRR